MLLKSFQLAHVMWPEWDWGRPFPLPPAVQCLAQLLYTGFHRFLARFSDACSSRTTPKPRPPVPTVRPNITFHTYQCPPDYAAWYCLNDAKCFTVKIGNTLLYNCECAEGYMGQRSSQRKFMLETASIAGGASIAVFLVVILCVVVWLHVKRRTKSKRGTAGADSVDGGAAPAPAHAPTFGTRWRTAPPPAPPHEVSIRMQQDRGDVKSLRSSKVELHQVTAFTSPAFEP
ncbi:unnamed protein product [Brassicogethes aeneus]|uniref:Uncharacterized protein n=1 Tax=Brassicogethes aeneus TaxID=1431903 RepID=A0A9P0ASA2_BRAAE|nr:unnamed protein product [Brassicogethes aeneus]